MALGSQFASLAGVGIKFSQDDMGKTRIKEFVDTLAPASGLEINDEILCVDSIPVRGQDLEFLRRLIIGDEGSSILFSISRISNFSLTCPGFSEKNSAGPLCGLGLHLKKGYPRTDS